MKNSSNNGSSSILMTSPLSGVHQHDEKTKLLGMSRSQYAESIGCSSGVIIVPNSPKSRRAPTGI